MVLILFIGMIIFLFFLLSYALCRASAEGDRSFGYSEAEMKKDEMMTDEDVDKDI